MSTSMSHCHSTETIVNGRMITKDYGMTVGGVNLHHGVMVANIARCRGILEPVDMLGEKFAWPMCAIECVFFHGGRGWLSVQQERREETRHPPASSEVQMGSDTSRIIPPRR